MRNRNDNLVYVVALNRETFGGSATFVDVVEKHRKYFYPVGSNFPKPHPNYLGFRYDGYVKSIHFVECCAPITDYGPHFPEQPSREEDPHWLFRLGPPIRPPNDMRVGANLFAQQRWCPIDLLLTSDTFAAALDAYDERKRRIDGTDDE